MLPPGKIEMTGDFVAEMVLETKDVFSKFPAGAWNMVSNVCEGNESLRLGFQLG